LILITIQEIGIVHNEKTSPLYEEGLFFVWVALDGLLSLGTVDAITPSVDKTVTSSLGVIVITCINEFIFIASVSCCEK